MKIKPIKVVFTTTLSLAMVFGTCAPAYALEKGHISINYSDSESKTTADNPEDIKYPTFNIKLHSNINEDGYQNDWDIQSSTFSYKLGDIVNLSDEVFDVPSDMLFNSWTSEPDGGIQWGGSDKYIAWMDADLYAWYDQMDPSSQGFANQALKEWNMAQSNYGNENGYKYTGTTDSADNNPTDYKWQFDFVKFCARQSGLINEGYFPQDAKSIEDLVNWIGEDQTESNRGIQFNNTDSSNHPKIGDIAFNDQGRMGVVVESTSNQNGDYLYRVVEGNYDGFMNMNDEHYSFKNSSEFNNFVRLSQPEYFNYDLSDSYLLPISDQVYNGEPITIENIMVKYGSKIIPSSMYNIEYQDNDIVQGQAKVVVTAKPELSDYINGTLEGSFNISGVNFDKVYVSCNTAYYGGIPATPSSISCKINNKEVPKDYYSISYANNNTVAGIGKLTIKPNGCSTGDSKTINYQIRPNLSKANISGISNKVYTGKAIKQTPKLTIGGKTVSATYYNVTHTNNTKPGKATVKITAKNGSTSSKTANFTISKSPIKSLTLKSSSVKYDKKTHKPAIKLVKASTGNLAAKNYTVQYLRNGKITKDFKSKGKITVKVTGKNYWTGSKTATFTIK